MESSPWAAVGRPLDLPMGEEAAGRDQATIATRRRASGLPTGKTLEALGPRRLTDPQAHPAGLARPGVGEPRRKPLRLRPSGTGKSHLVEALGHHAIDHGKTVAWRTLESLAALLRRHRADDSVNKVTGRLIRSDLIDHRRRRHAARRPRHRRSAVSRRRRRLATKVDFVVAVKRRALAHKRVKAPAVVDH